MWRNQSQWHFCVVKSTFIFTFVYGFCKHWNKIIKEFAQMYNCFHISISQLIVALASKLHCPYQTQWLTCFVASLSPCALHSKAFMQMLILFTFFFLFIWIKRIIQAYHVKHVLIVLFSKPDYRLPDYWNQPINANICCQNYS